MSLGVALLLAVAVALPAVWWEPLHVDEAITLQYAPESPPTILRDVFVERGGAPAFFLIEHVTLQWPGGLVGLRAPSLLLFLVAVVVSAPVGCALGGRGAALLLPPLLAVAPLAVRLSTFARMYALFLACVLVAVWLLLRAARRDSRSAWIAAGAVTGALVYVHPIAPLYMGIALATAFLCSGAPLREFVRSSRAGLVTLAAVAAPYAYALAVLGRRYGVGSSESSLLRGSSDRPVSTESLLSLSSERWLGAAVLGAFALAGLIAALRADRRTGIALSLWIAVPVAFFSLVPAETAFFPRYLLPALPFFLLLVALGCLAAGGLVRRPLPVAAALVAAIVVWQAVEAASRLDRLRDLRLSSIVGTAADGGDAALFSSIGTPLAGRPAELLDLYAALELEEAARVEELPGAEPAYTDDLRREGAAAVREFVRGEEGRLRGIWLFGGAARRLDRAARRLEVDPDLEVERVSPGVLLVRSREPLGARALVEQGIGVRAAWLGEQGRDRWARTLIAIDRDGLAGER